jgi:hypothetical protein
MLYSLVVDIKMDPLSFHYCIVLCTHLVFNARKWWYTLRGHGFESWTYGQLMVCCCRDYLWPQCWPGQAQKLLRITGILGFVHCPVFWKLENTAFWKLDLFLSSDVRDGGRHSFGSLGKRTNLNHWTWRLALCNIPNRCLSPHMRTETYPFSETLRSLVFRIADKGQKSKNPVILSVKHSQNPLEPSELSAWLPHELSMLHMSVSLTCIQEAFDFSLRQNIIHYDWIM